MILSGKNTLIQVRQFDNSDISKPRSVILVDKDSGQINFSFRYFRFKIFSTYSSDNKLQFSRLQFYSDDGKVFQYDANKTVKYTNDGGYVTITPYDNEGLENALISQNVMDNRKLCGYINSRPVFLTVDLKSPKLNIKTYKHWRFYNSWDTSSYPRIALSFVLEVSVDGQNWIDVDDQSQRKNITTVQNYAQQYYGDIKIKI